MDQPHITGDWRSDDQSANRIEVAPTDLVLGSDGQQEHAIELRSTANPEQFLVCTPSQLKKLSQAALARDSNVHRVLEAASR